MCLPGQRGQVNISLAPHGVTHHVIPTPCITLGQVPSLWILSSDKKIVFEELKANCYYTMEKEIFFLKW